MRGTPCSTQLIFAETQLEKAHAEIEILRQRVAELGGYKDAWIETAKCRDTAERELAALKAENYRLVKQLAEHSAIFIRDTEWAMVNELGFAHVELSRIGGDGKIPLYAIPPTCR